MNDLEALFGKNIHVVTERDLLESGELIEPCPKEFPNMLITPGVDAACKHNGEDTRRTYQQVLVPLLTDVAMKWNSMTKKQRQAGNHVLEHTAAGTVWFDGNGLGSLTVYHPSER